jgi:glutathione S-transferase
MDYAAEITLAEAAIKAARTECYRKEADARREFSAIAQPLEDMMEALTERFSTAVFQLACAGSWVPYDRYGRRQFPSSLQAKPEGILAKWFENDGHDHEFLATWEALAAWEDERSNTHNEEGA